MRGVMSHRRVFVGAALIGCLGLIWSGHGTGCFSFAIGIRVQGERSLALGNLHVLL